MLIIVLMLGHPSQSDVGNDAVRTPATCQIKVIYACQVWQASGACISLPQGSTDTPGHKYYTFPTLHRICVPMPFWP